ncbi:hypothetical protein NLN62_11295 [Bradyrhizobium sp. CCGUVB23]|nr:hypothetical protein [Bradyrhizobium sp. CCGUVB23]MCP3460867.1 hypothetical protein [Bradyrhizobium sp. CCGUVB23]
MTGAQDIFYVGNTKGAWARSISRPFMDIYSQAAFAKLYNRKAPVVTRRQSPG